MNPLDKVINTIGDALKNAKHFKGDLNYPAPIYMNGGWLVPDWITPKKLEDPEIIEFLKESGFLTENFE